MRRILIEHAKKYPLMQPTDAVKLVYQATFGGGHMIKDEQSALEYIRREHGSCSHSGEGFRSESLGDTSRVYLDGTLTDTELSLIAKMFCLSAKSYAVGFGQASDAVKKLFLARIDGLRQTCQDGHFPFDAELLDEYLADYSAKGYPPVSHSEIYKEAYHPSYRVIDSRYARLIPCIRKIAASIDAGKSRIVAAIDGRCASGKTTSADFLAKLFEAEIIHMDDFFLPPELRSANRLSEIGGNIHYERFEGEVLPFLRSSEPFTHRVFDCSQFAYSAHVRTVSPTRVIIVDGVYSLHPNFADYFDIAIFSDVSHTEQIERIKRRNGEAMLKRFMDEWIPMEERYFENFNIKSKCDFII